METTEYPYPSVWPKMTDSRRHNNSTLCMRFPLLWMCLSFVLYSLLRVTCEGSYLNTTSSLAVKRAALLSKQCEGQWKQKTTEHKVKKRENSTSCSLLPGPPLVQNSTSRRHQVLFPLKISDALDVLLQETINKKLTEKSKKTKKSSHHDKHTVNLLHPKLYLGGDVKTQKQKQQKKEKRRHKETGRKRTPSASPTDVKRKGEQEIVIPEFPEDYHASGLLILPHSGIAEPFEIWYSPSKRKSRIDYYYGTDKTYQLGDVGKYGEAYKHVPMYNDRDKGFDGCWAVTGTANRPIIPQTITPNITWFKYNGTVVYTGTLTTRWTYQYYAFGMRNSQTVWVTKAKPNRPIRYEMYGFDTMLGSYYDNYVIEYISFEKLNYDKDMFGPPNAETKCFHWGFSLESSLHVNPMQEFAVFSPDNAINIEKLYEGFLSKQQKRSSITKNREKRDAKRLHVFHHHARLISSHNRKNATFKLKPNHFVSLTHEELEAHHGSLEPDPGNHTGILEGKDLPPSQDFVLPDAIDWREYGAVSHVKGQGICGACYAFTAAGAAEGAWYRKTGRLTEVSSQQILDCSWGYGNHGCKGGHYATALSWIYTHGISTDKSYGKFLAQEGYCHFNDTWFGAQIDGFSYIQPWNQTALKIAIAKYGPVAVSINTRPLTFKFYSHGIYNDPKCVRNETTHSALVVGYGKEGEHEYWIVKNSWSSTWGEHGYIRVSMKDDLCGITEYPVAVVVYHPQFQHPHNTKAGPKDVGSKVHPSSRNSGDGGNKPTSPLAKFKEWKSNNTNTKKVKNIRKPKVELNKKPSIASTKVKKVIKNTKKMTAISDTSSGAGEKSGKNSSINILEGDEDDEHSQKHHIDDSPLSGSGEADVEDGENSIGFTADDTLKRIKSHIDDERLQRVNLTLSLFKEGIFNQKLFDSLLKNDKKNRTPIVVSKKKLELKKSKPKEQNAEQKVDKSVQNKAEFKDETITITITKKGRDDDQVNRTGVDQGETNREEEKEPKKSNHSQMIIARKVENANDKELKINTTVNKIAEELRSDSIMNEQKEERRKALIKEQKEEVKELQEEEKKKALLKERQEELDEVEQEKHTSEEHKSDTKSERLKEENEVEKESKEQLEQEERIEKEVDKEAKRRKEKEEEKKVELEEAWKTYLENERRKGAAIRNSSLTLYSQKGKVFTNYSNLEVNNGTGEEFQSKTKESTMQSKKDLSEMKETMESAEDKEKAVDDEGGVEDRMKRLLDQQTEISKLMNQLKCLKVSEGHKKSIVYALHQNSSFDQEKTELYSSMYKGKTKRGWFLGPVRTSSQGVEKKFNIPMLPRKVMPKLLSAISSKHHGELSHFGKKSENWRRPRTEGGYELDNGIKRIALNINMIKRFINHIQTRKTKDRKKSRKISHTSTKKTRSMKDIFAKIERDLKNPTVLNNV